MGNFISKENVTREVYAYQLLSYSKQTNTQLTTGKDNWVYVASVINDLKLSNTEKLSMFLQFALKDRRITPVKELLEIFKYALSKTSNSSYFDYFTTMGEVISYFGPKPSSRDTFWIETGFGSRRSLDIQPSSVVKILSSKDFYRYSNKGLSHPPNYWTASQNQFRRFCLLFACTKVANTSLLSRAWQAPRASAPLTTIPFFAPVLLGKYSEKNNSQYF